MAGQEQVKSYQRTTESGRVITVKAYDRANSDVAESVATLPGRPRMAAKGGSFAGGRSIPGVWVKPSTPPAPVVAPGDPSVPEETTPQALATADKLAESLKDVPGAEAALKALAALKGQKPAAPSSLSEKTAKVVRAAAALRDPNVIELALNPVRVRSYKRRSNLTGKIVDVQAYTQIRDLVSALGGPQMAAKKGITAEVFKPAMPDLPDDVFRPAAPDKPQTPKTPAAPSLPDGKAPRKPQATPDAPSKPAAPQKTPTPDEEPSKALGGLQRSVRDRRRKISRQQARQRVETERAELAALKDGDADGWAERSKAYTEARDADRVEEPRYLSYGYSVAFEKADNGGSFNAWILHKDDDEGEGTVVGESYFADVGDEVQTVGVTHPDHKASGLLSAVRDLAEMETGKTVTIDPTVPRTPPANEVSKSTVNPPTIGRRPLVNVTGHSQWGSVYGPKLVAGDRVFKARGHGPFQGYAFVGKDEDGKDKITGFLYTSYDGEPALGEAYDIANFLGDAQQAYERDEDLPELDYDEFMSKIWDDDGFRGTAVLDDFFDEVWTQPEVDFNQHVKGITDHLATLPSGTKLQDARGDTYGFDGTNWTMNGKATVPPLMVASRLSMNHFGTPEQMVADSKVNAGELLSAKTFSHNLRREPANFDRGFPRVTGEGGGEMGQRAKSAVTKALSFVPEAVAKQFPDTFVNHSRTEELSHGDGGSIAFVANYGNRQELHLTNQMGDERFEARSAFMQSSGFTVKTDLDAFDQVVAHESGHVFENLLTFRGSKENKDRYYSDLLQVFAEEYGYTPRQSFDINTPRDAYIRAVEDLKQELRRDVSQYGATNDREVIAEAWAEFVGSKNARPVVSKLGAAMQRMTERLAEEIQPGSMKADKGTERRRPEPSAPELARLTDPAERDKVFQKYRNVLRAYQTDAGLGYVSEVNSALRSIGTMSGPENPDEVNGYKQLHAAAEAFPAERNLKVYRGGNAKDMFADALSFSVRRDTDLNDLVGKTVTDQGFMSTSEDSGVARGFTGADRKYSVVLELDVPAGHGAIPLGDAPWLRGGDRDLDSDPEYRDFLREQKERLLDAGTTYKVTEVSRDERGVWHVKGSVEEPAGEDGPVEISRMSFNDKLVASMAEQPIGKATRAPGKGMLLKTGDNEWTQQNGDDAGRKLTDAEVVEFVGEERATNMRRSLENQKAIAEMEANPPEPDPVPVEEPEVYTGSHRPPDDGARINNVDELNQMLPDVHARPDLYSFDRGSKADKESLRVLQSLKGKPDDTPVKIYRAVPPGVTEINDGDWVAISRAYAEQHAIDGMGPGQDFDIIESEVPAGSIRNGGNDYIEWGYWGPSTGTPKTPAGDVVEPGGPGVKSAMDKILADRHPGVEMSLGASKSRPDQLRLSLIRTTDEKARGEGKAGAAMRDLLAEADKRGVTVTLTPEPMEGDRKTSKTKLRAWYKALGFVENKGRNKNFEISDAMYRDPLVNSAEDPLVNRARTP